MPRAALPSSAAERKTFAIFAILFCSEAITFRLLFLALSRSDGGLYGLMNNVV